jgi:hypothetical protein
MEFDQVDQEFIATIPTGQQEADRAELGTRAAEHLRHQPADSLDWPV